MLQCWNSPNFIQQLKFCYFYRVKKIDKLKKQRFEISMKIIQIEDKLKKSKLSKNEEKELEILKHKEEELDNKIESLS